jgi:DNA-binding ferritin-like protein
VNINRTKLVIFVSVLSLTLNFINDMAQENFIGLDVEKSKELADALSDLLANYSIFYQNTRGYHWNITGDKFFELHLKFEELYNDLFEKIDEVAERILTLGYNPVGLFTSFLPLNQISSWLWRLSNVSYSHETQ